MAVKRYDFDDTGESNYLIETQLGDWVRYEDYAALESLATDLVAELDDRRAECERLRGELNKGTINKCRIEI